MIHLQKRPDFGFFSWGGHHVPATPPVSCENDHAAAILVAESAIHSGIKKTHQRVSWSDLSLWQPRLYHVENRAGGILVTGVYQQ